MSVPSSSQPNPRDSGAVRRRRKRAHSSTRLEPQVRNLQRLATQGELAATAVHEISNLLTIVLFNAGLLRLRHRDEPDILKYVGPILHAAEVVGSVCNQLRNLTRPAPAQLREIDLTETTRRTFALLDQIMQCDLTLEAPEGEPIMIVADPAHIDQIVVNLVLNARDATAEVEGRVRLRVGCLPDGGKRFLEVIDNGAGMTPQVRRKVFKAFFTTKPAGRGTGLGLATVRRLVRGLGGSIRLQSKPGHGTTVRVLFPPPPAESGNAPVESALSSQL